MAYIIFDLEWNQPYGNDISFMKRTGFPVAGEIIEFGAVKLDDRFKIIDQFKMLVKPKFLPRINRQVAKLTHISQADLQYGLPFPKAYEHFVKWCGLSPILLSWGPDDMTLLQENCLIYKIRPKKELRWYDAQFLYAYEINGDAQQVSLQKAMEQLAVRSDDLPAHDALNDAIFTARLCQKLHIKEGLAAYEAHVQDTKHFEFFPKHMTFFMYENFDTKDIALRTRKVREVYCPSCLQRMQVEPMVRWTGSKYLSLAHCPKHKTYAVQWRLGRYLTKLGRSKYYIGKLITEAPSQVEALYRRKYIRHKEKEAAYRERMHK
ncbi:MAG: 3'-5' exonuclease [Veillonellaceae bacterium]|nr:3'-5' exonuclease [Veillonellaceae bacterium]